MWNLYKAGFRIVNFVHDEFIVELKNDEHLHENCRLVDRIMLESMQQVIKHTKIGVEGALMDRWIKSASPIFDIDGTMLIFTESCMKVEKEKHKNTPECFPLAGEAEGKTPEQIAVMCPQGFRVLFDENQKLWGFQPLNEVVPQVHTNGEIR